MDAVIQRGSMMSLHRNTQIWSQSWLFPVGMLFNKAWYCHTTRDLTSASSIIIKAPYLNIVRQQRHLQAFRSWDSTRSWHQRPSLILWYSLSIDCLPPPSCSCHGSSLFLSLSRNISVWSFKPGGGRRSHGCAREGSRGDEELSFEI